MLRRYRIVMLCLLASLCAAILQAQPPADPYADLPKSRGADGAFILGEPDARMKLIEFADFLCVSCQNYKPIISSFLQDYVLTGQAQFEYRIFPVVDPQLSPLSAGLVECADNLRSGLFWQAHDLMYELVSTDGFTGETSIDFAEALELDQDALTACAASADQYQTDAAYGARLGVTGTPSLFLQYGEADPVQISLALPEHYPAIVNALRPESTDPVTIEHGRYAGLSTYRRADGGFVLGDPSAPVTLVTFEDFLCPYCQSYQSTVQIFIEQYVRAGKAQFEYRFYPLVNPQFSTSTAKIAECVAVQDLGKFWDGHDLLYEFASTGNLNDMAGNIAKLLDLDGVALEDCLDRSIQFLIDTQLGQASAVSGTPAVRARDENGNLQIIYSGQQALDRGGAPIDVLSALAEGTGGVSIGAPEVSLLNDNLLVDNSIITAEPCGPPCWQNIVPGETSLSDALAIVQELEQLEVLASQGNNFVFGLVDGTICCQIYSQDGELVTSILLQLAPEISAAEAIAALVEPPLISGQPFTETEAVLMFVYPEKNTLLYAFVPGIEGRLSESSPIVSALYATDELFAEAFEATPFDHWKGYLKYSDYMDGEYDYTPES